jgi:hypothetical protein
MNFFTPISYNYSVMQGAYLEIPFTVTDDDDAPIDLTDIPLTGRFRHRAIEGAVEVELAIDDGITLLDGPAGQVMLALTYDMPSDTYDFEVWGAFPDPAIGAQPLVKGACVVYPSIM